MPAIHGLTFRGEFLHVFLKTEQVRSHLPATVTRGGTVIRADAFNYDNLERTVEMTGHVRASFAARRRHAAAAIARSRRHDGTAGLHHRRLERHRSGAGGSLCEGGLSAGAGGAARRAKSRPGRAAQGLGCRARRGLLGRRARHRQHHRRGTRVHRRAGTAGRRDRKCRHQRRRRQRRVCRPRAAARHLRDQQPRDGGDVPALRARHARAPLGYAGRHRQRRRHPGPAGSRRLQREQGGRHQLLREPAWRVPAVRRESGHDRARATSTRR